MSPAVRATARRKSAGERRAEIANAAADTALTDGIEAITLRSVAGRLGITYGLVNHYFPAVQELRVVAFAHAVGRDLDATLAEVRQRTTSQARLAELLAQWVSPDRDQMGLLWLDAWSHARHNVTMRDAVHEAMRLGHRAVSQLIAEGTTDGTFRCEDPQATAWRLLTLLDGQIVHSSLDIDDRPVMIRDAVAAFVEGELGLAPRSLGKPDGAAVRPAARLERRPS